MQVSIKQPCKLWGGAALRLGSHMHGAPWKCRQTTTLSISRKMQPNGKAELLPREIQVKENIAGVSFG